MTWLVTEMLGPLARRFGGQVSAFLAALGMATEHQAAVAAVVAWGVITIGEAAFDARSRRNLREEAKKAWGKNA